MFHGADVCVTDALTQVVYTGRIANRVAGLKGLVLRGVAC